jgi:phosphatidate phosphatase APP1
MVDWVRLGADMEEMATRSLQGARRVGGLGRPMVVQPYRGFVAQGVAHVRARVREAPVFEAAADSLRIDATLVANLLRWVVLDLPGVSVEVSVAGHSVTAISNQEGFIVAKVPVGDLAPGWHTVDFAATDRDGGEVTAHGRVVHPNPSAPTAIITDIDDTILRTGITEGMKSVQRTLLRDAHGRKPIPGMPSLYRGLARGTGDHAEATVFYVSAAPWNLYEMFVQFLQIRGFPCGPLFLTDWRPGSTVEGEDVPKVGHKMARIRRLLDSYPELSFVLVGDTGEADAAVYQRFLDSDGGRIAAALLREVEAPINPLRLLDRGHKEIALDTRAPIECEDALQMAQVALQLGLIDDLTVEEVATELGARL